MAGAWLVRGGRVPLDHTVVMGILNVTPDSFSDGGRYLDPQAALVRAAEMEAQGAEILDVGGQSTRPRHVPISPEEEWARLEPVLIPLLAQTALVVSVDTFYPQVAEKALAAGAHVINDVSGCGDEMLRAVAGSGCGCVVTHPQGGRGGDLLEEVRGFFQERLEAADRLGVEAGRLCFDPGIGFGKTRREDLELLANAGAVKLPGRPLLIAASRKRVTALGGDLPPDQRVAATLAAHTAAVLAGAEIVRAHDVAQAVQAARMADLIRRHRAGAAEWKGGF